MVSLICCFLCCMVGDGLGEGYGMLGQAGSGKLRVSVAQTKIAKNSKRWVFYNFIYVRFNIFYLESFLLLYCALCLCKYIAELSLISFNELISLLHLIFFILYSFLCFHFFILVFYFSSFCSFALFFFIYFGDITRDMFLFFFDITETLANNLI